MSFAQITIEGKVIDEKNEPIAFAHITVENENVGTISNSEGQFKLISSKRNILISAIGYLTRKVVLDEGYHVLKLTQEIIELEEVTLVSRDYAKELIQKAVNKIPYNYPDVEERHKGFYREQARWEGEKELIYITEAAIEAIKEPYSRLNRSGHVKLVEFRKYKGSQLDSLNKRFYGGGHDVHSLDIVARRGVFLKNPNAFDFKLIDTLQQHGNLIYKILFERKNKESGHVFIMDSTFAFIRFDYKSSSFFKFPGKNRQYRNYSVSYEQSKGKKWRFKQSHYDTAFKEKSKLLTLTSDYVTTEVEINKIVIPYLERMQFRDVLLEQTKEYTPYFWENYNIILPDPETEFLFKSKKTSKIGDSGSKSLSLGDIIRKLKFEMLVEWLPINISMNNITYMNTAIDIEQGRLFEKQQTWGLSYSFLYEIGTNLFLGYANKTKLGKSGITSHDISLSRAFNLNPKGRPVFVSFGMNVGHQELVSFLDTFETTTAFQVNDKSFKSEKIDVFLARRGLRFQPNLALKLESTSRLSLLLATGYNFQSNGTIGLRFNNADRSSLFGKKAFLKNGRENLLIDYDGNLLENNVSVSAGILYRF